MKIVSVNVYKQDKTTQLTPTTEISVFAIGTHLIRDICIYRQ